MLLQSVYTKVEFKLSHLYIGIGLFVSLFCSTRITAQTLPNDSISYAVMGSSGEHYFTISGDPLKVTRWQHFTGRLLTNYEPVPNLLTLYSTDEAKQVIGVTKNEVVIWNVYSGTVTSRIAYPATFQNSFSNSSYAKDRRHYADFDPVSNKLLVSSGRSVILMDISKKEVIHTASFNYFIEYPTIIKNGSTMLAIENITNEVFSLGFQDKQRRTIMSDALTSSLGASADHKRFFIGDFNGLAVYNDSFQLDFKMNPVLRFSSPNHSQFLDNFDMIANTRSADYLYFFINGYKEPINVKSPIFIEGISAAKGNLLSWNKEAISISDFTGQQLFYQPHFNTGLFSERDSKLKLGTTDTTLTLSAGSTGKTIDLLHENPVTVFTSDKILASGDINGNVYWWSAEGKLISKIEVLSGAISHLRATGPETVLVGGYGRMVEYNLKTRTNTRLLRGQNGTVISSYFDAATKLLITGTSGNQLLLWDLTSGSLIKSYATETTPVYLSFTGKEVVYGKEKENSSKLTIAEDLTNYYNPPRKIIINTTHRSSIESLSFNADGKQLLSTDDEGVIKVWDVASLVPVRTLFLNNSASHSVFSHDGKEVLNFNQDHIYHINAATGQLIQDFAIPGFFKDVKVHNLSMHPNNRTVYIDNNNGAEQVLLNLNLQKFFFIHNADHQYGPFGQDINRDGSHLATLGNNVEIWDLTTGEKIKTIEHPNNHYKNKYAKRLIRYSPDAKLLLLEKDKGYRVYNLETGKDAITLHTAFVPVFTGNNKLIYYDKNKDLVGINLTTGQEYLRLSTPGEQFIPDVTAYDSTNNLLAVGFYNGEIRILNPDNGNTIKANRVQASRTVGAINPVTGEMAMGIPDKVKIFDWLQAREKKMITVGRTGSVPKVSYSPNGQQMLVSLNNNTLLYTAPEGKLSYAFSQGGTGKFSLDSRFLSIEEFDSLFVYDLKSSNPLQPVIKHKNHYFDYAFVPGKNEIHITRSQPKKDQDKLVYFDSKDDFFLMSYDLISGKLIKETPVTGHYYVSSLTYTPDKKYSFFEVHYGRMIINDLQSGKSVELSHGGPIDFTSVSPDSRHIIIGNDEGGLFLYDIKNGKLKASLVGHSGPIRSVSFWKDYMFSSSSDGSGIVWDTQKNEKLVQVNPFSNGDYIFINKENYYTGTTGISQAVFFNQKDKVFPFEQYDLIYNRPDLVVKNLDSSNTSLTKAYYEAYAKRLKKHGFTIEQVSDVGQNAPLLKLKRSSTQIETTSKKVSFGVEAKENTYFLESMNLWVNDVPLYGAGGLSFKGKKLKDFLEKVTIELCQGRNKIQVSCYNSKGIESVKETFELTYNPPQPKKPNLYLIALSVSDYQSNAFDLKYARKDGHDLVNTFLENKEDYETIFVDTLFDKNAVKENFLAVKKRLEASSVDDHVILFISGHGLLDKKFNFYYATYDCDFKNPEKRGLAYEEIESILDAIPARHKVLLMDACHSGEVDKGSLEIKAPALEKGVTATFQSNKRGGDVDNVSSGMSLSNSFLLMQELFANLNRGSGAVVISASAGDSYAYESDKWKNGIFTYTLLEGIKTMKADLNSDDIITVNELKEYVYKNVETATGGNQKPTARQQNLELNFRMW